jgi:cleavage and polyadenylation specificity factor subunit 1
MNKEIDGWSKTCIACQTSKVHRHNVAPIGSFSENASRFEHIHLDLVGPLPVSVGHTYLLTCVDRFTRWPEAIPISDITAETVARTFVNNWVSRYGVPSTITTDRGSQLESRFLNEMLRLLGTQRIRTTAYHPQANGAVERFHRTLKGALKAQQNPNDWCNNLELVMLGLRSTLKEELNASPAEMIYGQPLRLPGDFFEAPDNTNETSRHDYVEQLKTHMKSCRYQPHRKQQRKSYIAPDLKECAHIFVRRRDQASFATFVRRAV